MRHDRREFLRRLVRGVAYSAPAVLSFRIPAAAQGPGMSSEMNPMGGGHGDPMGSAAFEPQGPWDNPPPTQRGPGPQTTP